MERLKSLNKNELIKVIDLLLKFNLNDRQYMLGKVLRELEYEKENQLIDEEMKAFEAYIKARTDYQNACIAFMQLSTGEAMDREGAKLKRMEKEVHKAWKKYESLREQLRTIQGV